MMATEGEEGPAIVLTPPDPSPQLAPPFLLFLILFCSFPKNRRIWRLAVVNQEKRKRKIKTQTPAYEIVH
jgi:hypothetical protein